MTSDRRDAEAHLRAASDAILLLLGEVGQLERHKRGVRPGDARFAELARSVRLAAQHLAEFTEQEEAWARSASVEADDVGAISDSDSAPSLAAILDRWRDVERRLNEADPGSAESARLFAEFERIRDQYMAAFRARTDDG
jgi:hypothetical protein